MPQAATVMLPGGLLDGPGFCLLCWKATSQNWQVLGRIHFGQIWMKLSLKVNYVKQLPAVRSRNSINSQLRDWFWSPMWFMLFYLHLLALTKPWFYSKMNMTRNKVALATYLHSLESWFSKKLQKILEKTIKTTLGKNQSFKKNKKKSLYLRCQVHNPTGIIPSTTETVILFFYLKKIKQRGFHKRENVLLPYCRKLIAFEWKKNKKTWYTTTPKPAAQCV